MATKDRRGVEKLSAQENAPSGGSEESRQKLLVAARECLLDRGYAATSVKDIAARAGVNHGLVHHYFASKEGLYAELLRWDSQERNARVRAEVTQQGAIEVFEQNYVHSARLMLEFHAMAHEMPSIKTGLKEMLHAGRVQVREDLQLTDDVDAYVVMAALGGLALLYNADSDLPVAGVVSRVLGLFAQPKQKPAPQSKPRSKKKKK